MPGDKIATFSLNLESNAAAISKDATKGLEGYKKSIEDSNAAIKNLSAAQKALRGTSDEVVAAKAQLKGKIEAERGAISQANLAILKQGQTYEKLTASTKKTAAEEIKKTEATKKGIESVKEAIRDVEKYTLVLTGLAAAGTFVGYEFAKLVVTQADQLRTMNLTREAASGSAQNAKNLGTQIDALAQKIPTSTEKLNELAVSLTRSLSGGYSRASGQAIVDTFDAVAESASAMGDEVGKRIGDIVDRGKRMGRIRINPFELQGTGLQFQDIAGALAKNMKVGIKQAETALFQGRVSLDAGAAALKDAVEKRFGSINARALIGLDALSTKLHDNWRNLTKGVDLEPILGGFKKIVDLFQTTTEEGKAIEELFEGIGKDLGTGVTESVPLVQEGIRKIILAAYDLEIKFYETKKSILGSGNAVQTLVQDVKDLGAAAATAAYPFIKMAEAAKWYYDHDVKAVGVGIFAVQDAIANRQARERAGMGTGNGVDDLPGHASGGIVKGIRNGVATVRPAPGEGLASIGPGESIVPAGRAGGSVHNHNNRVSVDVHVHGGANAYAAAERMKEPDVLGAITKAIRDALIGAGVPTQSGGEP